MLTTYDATRRALGIHNTARRLLAQSALPPITLSNVFLGKYYNNHRYELLPNITEHEEESRCVRT
jgi:hypothetical protein